MPWSNGVAEQAISASAGGVVSDGVNNYGNSAPDIFGRWFNDLSGKTALNQFNRTEAAANRAWQQEMSNTAVQRQMADMKAAGINPVMASSQGGASSPAGSTASAAGSGNGVVGALGQILSTVAAKYIGGVFSEQCAHTAASAKTDSAKIAQIAKDARSALERAQKDKHFYSMKKHQRLDPYGNETDFFREQFVPGE